MPADFSVPHCPDQTYRLVDETVRRVDPAVLSQSRKRYPSCLVRGCEAQVDAGLVCETHMSLFASYSHACDRCGTPAPIACETCAACDWAVCGTCGAYHVGVDLCDGRAVTDRSLISAYRGNATSCVAGPSHGRAPLRSVSTAHESGARCYGLEIEVECLYRAQSAAVGALWAEMGPDAILAIESDGSIGDAGFEIITQPLTVVEHAAMLPRLCEIAVRYGCRGHQAGTGYGLHVHASREDARWPGVGVTSSEAQLLARLFRSSPRLFASLARREPTTYCSFTCSPQDHYAAVSLRPAGTVEFRSARSSLKASTLIAWVDLIDRAIAGVRGENPPDTLRALLRALPEDCPARAYALERGAVIDPPTDTQPATDAAVGA